MKQIASEPVKQPNIALPHWKRINAELEWIYDGAPPREGHHPQSHIPHCCAWLIRTGKIEYQWKGEPVRTILPGQWFFTKSGPRQHFVHPGTTLLSIAYYLHWPNQLPLFYDGLNLTLDADSIPSLEKAAIKMLKIRNKCYQAQTITIRDRWELPPHYLELQARCYDWLNLLYTLFLKQGIKQSYAKDLDSRMQKAMRAIELHPMVEPFDEAAIAASLGIGYKQLRRLFSQEFNMTPNQFYNQCKLKRAQNSLRMGEIMIKEIAFQLGFKTTSHFTTWFKKHMDFTPDEYRKILIAKRY